MATQIGDARFAIQQARMIMRTRGIFVPFELIEKFQNFWMSYRAQRCSARWNFDTGPHWSREISATCCRTASGFSQTSAMPFAIDC
jgi:hypothetical protein